MSCFKQFTYLVYLVFVFSQVVSFVVGNPSDDSRKDTKNHQHSSDYPLGASLFDVSHPTTHSLKSILRNRGNCLSTEEQQKLSQSLAVIEKFLSTASFGLEAFAGSVQDDSQRNELLYAATVFKKVNIDIVMNLTRIAEESCGSCVDIADAVKDASNVLFHALVDIEPTLKNDRVYDSLVTGVNAAVIIAEDICKTLSHNSTHLHSIKFDKNRLIDVSVNQIPASFSLSLKDASTLFPQYMLNKDCLNQEQKDDIQEVIELLGNVLNTFSQWLRESEGNAKSKELKFVLDQLADMFEDERLKLHDHGAEIVERFCEDCSQSAQLIKRVVSMVEKTLDDIFPAWKDITKLHDLFEKIDKVLLQIKDICPYGYAHHQLYRLEIGLNNFIDISAYNQALKQIADMQYIVSMDHSSYALQKLRSKSKLKDFRSSWISCSDAVKNIELALNETEELISEMYPNWKEVPILEKLDEAAHNIVTNLEHRCPNTPLYVRHFSAMVKERQKECVIVSNEKRSRKILKEISNLFNEAELSLSSSNAYDHSNADDSISERARMHLHSIKTSVEVAVKETSINDCNVCSNLVVDSQNKLNSFILYLENTHFYTFKISRGSYIQKVLNDISTAIANLCDIKSIQIEKKCLSETERNQIEAAIKYADEVLEKTSEFVSSLEKNFSNKQMKDALRNLKQELDAERAELDKNGEQMVEDMCETCSKTSGYVYKMVSQVKDILNQFMPMWKDVDQIKQIFDDVDEILADLKVFCPYEFYSKNLFVLYAESSLHSYNGANKEEVVESMTTLQLNINNVFKTFSLRRNNKPFTNKLRSAQQFPSFNSVKKLEDQNRMSCLDVVIQIEGMLHKFEAFLNESFPGWQDMPLLPEIDDMIHAMLDSLHEKCEKEIFASQIWKNKVFAKAGVRCLSNFEKVKYRQDVDLVLSLLNDVQDFVMTSQVDNKALRVYRFLANNFVDIVAASSALRIKADRNMCFLVEREASSFSNLKRNMLNHLDNEFSSWWENIDVVEMVAKLEAVFLVFERLSLKDKLQETTAFDERQYYGNLVAFEPCTKTSKVSTGLRKGGCLVPAEKEQLKNVSVEVEIGLNFAAKMIHMYSDFETDPVKKYSLEMSAKVIEVLSKDVVENITILLDEYCGNCTDLADAVKDTLLTLERALFDVEPLWKDTPVYTAVQVVTENVFQRLQKLCYYSPAYKNIQTKKYLLGLFTNSSCLTPEEDESLRYYSEKIGELFDYAAQLTRILADEISDEYEKNELLFVAKVLQSVSHEIVANFTSIADESCGTCLDLIKVARDVEKLVEQTMSDVDPDWRRNGEYKEILVAFNAFLSIVEGLCPNTFPGVTSGLYYTTQPYDIKDHICRDIDGNGLVAVQKFKATYDSASDLIVKLVDALVLRGNDKDKMERLQKLESYIQSQKEKTDAQLSVVIKEKCINCRELKNDLNEMFESISNEIVHIDPAYGDSVTYASIQKANEYLLNQLESICEGANALLSEAKCSLTSSEIELSKWLILSRTIVSQFLSKVYSDPFLTNVLAAYDEELLKVSLSPCPTMGSLIVALDGPLSLNGLFLSSAQANTVTLRPFFEVDSALVRRVDDLNADCLTQQEKDELEVILRITDSVLHSVRQTLYTLSTDKKMNFSTVYRKKLNDTAIVVGEVEEEIKNKLKTVVTEASCGKCGDIVKALSDALYGIDELVKKINPKVQNDYIEDAVVVGLEALLDIVHNFCPEPKLQAKNSWFEVLENPELILSV